MKSLAIIVALALGGLAALSVAAARQSPIGCERQAKACRQTARVNYFACKQECRIGPASGMTACTRSCAGKLRSAKQPCRRERRSCVGMWSPPSPPTSCDGAFLDTCGHQLATCAQGILTGARACLLGCKAATSRVTCLEGCAVATEARGAACANAFAACAGRCRPTTTTTLPPPTCGLDPTTAVCGGRCPPGLACVPPPSESGIALACICRPPAGTCGSDQDCDDGNGCTKDHCVGGTCEHVCVCADPAGALTCCPGPAGLCPPPSGRCFVTVDLQCSDEPCGPDQPCRNPNEICSPNCSAPSTTTTTLPMGGCGTDADCNDGSPCTADRCVNGTCEHACICLGPAGASTCCPGPSALCIRPCGVQPDGSCGGFCPAGATCEPFRPGSPCGCVSGLGGPCGGNLLAPPIVCGPGLVCQQALPDATGVCVEQTGCIPFFQSGCTQTSDCCEPCGNGRIPPCAVCIQGECSGAP